MKKILQIIPADGWEAGYEPVNGEPVSNDTILCFALVEEDDSTYVEGMIAGEGSIGFCEGISTFKKYERR